ncbi:hypothetical protein [Streptomyces rimosus]|uniref:hypothetical protein n=1 Tax=Streptomyces rimosus TaxID=1927 RepID=UPI000519CED4|nr:hypothetical protein [Streptomyces rimosus]
MFFAAHRTGDASVSAARTGKRAGLRTAVVAAAASAAVAVPAVAAVAAPAHSAAPAKPAAAASAQGHDKKVKIANHYTLTWNAKKGTATIQDPDGETVGVLSANHPGPITSDFGDQGRTTYTMDAAMSSATVNVDHNGKVKSYDFLRA